MIRWLAAAAMLTILAAWLWAGSAGAQNGKPPTVKEVMKKINHRDTALAPVLGKMLKAETPNWEDIQKDAKLFLASVEELPKNDPPRGERTSWDKLTAAYVADAKALDAAAQRKDKAAALSAHAKIANPAYCNACHKMHRN